MAPPLLTTSMTDGRLETNRSSCRTDYDGRTNNGMPFKEKFGLTRENYVDFSLFIGDELVLGGDKGGKTAVVLFTMTQSAKRHDLNIFAYIEDVIKRLPGIPLADYLNYSPIDGSNTGISRKSFRTPPLDYPFKSPILIGCLPKF